MIKLFELFSGMGTQSIALKEVIKNYQIVGSCDFFLPAIAFYNCLHNKKYLKNSYKNIPLNEKKEYLKANPISQDSKKTLKPTYWDRKDDEYIHWAYKHVRISKDKYNNFLDINDIDYQSIPECDVLTYSFPCQDISRQGKGKGLSSTSKTRSSLVWKVGNIIQAYENQKKYPSILLMENVSAIENMNHIEQYNKWITFLGKHGYISKKMILNSLDFGSIQNRRRAFLISIHKDSKIVKANILDSFLVNYSNKTSKNISSILKKYPLEHEWYARTNFSYLLDKYDVGKFVKSKNNIIKSKLINYSNFNSEATIYSVKGKTPTLTATGANSRIKCYDPDTKELIALCPLACFLLMGFSEKEFNIVYEELQNYVSYTKLLHVIGNGIVKNVLVKIFKCLFKEDTYG